MRSTPMLWNGSAVCCYSVTCDVVVLLCGILLDHWICIPYSCSWFIVNRWSYWQCRPMYACWSWLWCWCTVICCSVNRSYLMCQQDQDSGNMSTKIVMLRLAATCAADPIPAQQILPYVEWILIAWRRLVCLVFCLDGISLLCCGVNAGVGT